MQEAMIMKTYPMLQLQVSCETRFGRATHLVSEEMASLRRTALCEWTSLDGRDRRAKPINKITLTNKITRQIVLTGQGTYDPRRRVRVCTRRARRYRS